MKNAIPLIFSIAKGTSCKFWVAPWLLISLLGFTPAYASLSCSELFSGNISPTLDSSAFPREIETLALRETTMNWYLSGMSPDLQRVPIVKVNPDSVEVRTAGAVDPRILGGIFDSQGYVLWPRHPRQQPTATIPHSRQATSLTKPGLLSASRSVFFHNREAAYSIKMPLSISALGGKSKGDLRKSVIVSVQRSKAIIDVDRDLGRDPGMITLLDVLSVADRKTGNGFVVRDLTPLEDGQETFPGFAMAARFKRYAKVTNQSLDKVMHRHFIIPFARSIAKILLRYGLLIEFPHDQNYLVRFDSKSGQPLDQIAWRDLSDTIPFLPVLESSGNLALSRLKAETLAGAYRTSDEVSFEFHQGHPKFLRGFDNQDAYHEQISIEIAKSVYKELGVPYKKSMLNDQTLSNLLNSPSGRSLIKAYHERLRTEQSRRKTED